MRETIRHHGVTIAFHWLTFAALIGSIGSIFGREFTEDDNLRLLLLNLHRSLGILILVIVLVRLMARFRFFTDDVAALLTTFEKRAAGLTHSAIYGLLLSVPLLGWLFTSAAGKPFVFFDLISLPALMAKNRAIAEQLGEIHEICAYALLALIGVHTLAALWHHFVKKDHILISMMPTLPNKVSD